MEDELQKLTVVKLREKLSEKGLDTKGVKAVLVKRLLDALQDEADTNSDMKDVTEDDGAPLTDEAPRFDADGKQPDASNVAEAVPESYSQKESDSSSQDEVPPMEGSESSDETRKRPADAFDGDVESKRQKLDATPENARAAPEVSDERDARDNMYLSLIGDESNGNDADASPAEPALTSQQEDSLLGEEPSDDQSPPPTHSAKHADNHQNALDPDAGHGSTQETSTATLPLADCDDVEGAQSSETTEKMAVDKPAGNGDPLQNEEQEVEQSAAKECEVPKDSSAVDPNRETTSDDSNPLTEKSAESRNFVEEDSEKKKEWIHKQQTTVSLDEYTSDLNCHIDVESMSITPFSDSHFALMYSGAKCTHGFVKGKIRFDVKVLELVEVDVGNEKHMLRVGFCGRLNQQSVRLGEDKYSWALCSNGKKASEGNFESFVELPDLKVGDIFSSLLNLDCCPAELKFAHNGKDLGVAFEVQLEPEIAVATKSEEAELLPASGGAEEQGSETTEVRKEPSTGESLVDSKRLALYPAVLTKNVKLEVDFGQIEEPLTLEGNGSEYVFPSKAEESLRVKDDVAPYTKRECELIMMIGLPSSGKSTWVQKHLQKHSEKHYNVLGTASVLSKMMVEGKQQTEIVEGGLDELVKRAMHCLTKLVETVAPKQRRNVILDETNVNGSVQANKWRLFDGFKRRAIVCVTTADSLKERHGKRAPEEIFLSDRTILEMKACFEIPSGSHFRGCVTFAELSRDEAEKVVEKYNEEAAKELGIEPRRRRRHQNQSDHHHHRSGSGGRAFHRGSSGSFNRSNYGDFRSRGSGRGNFHPGSTWGPMRGGAPNGPPSRWGRGGMPPMHFHPQQVRANHPNVGRLGSSGQYNRNGSEGGREGSGGDYRGPRPSWKQPPYHSNSRDRDGDDRGGRDSRRYGGSRDYRDDTRDSRDGGRDGWNRNSDRRESHTRLHSPPSRWSSSSASAGGRFGSQSIAPRGNPAYEAVQKPWTHAQHPPAPQAQQPQHKPTPQNVSQSSWMSSQGQQPLNQQQQQQQWYQWQQYYNDPRARPQGQQNPEAWKTQNPNQWVSAAAPRPGVSDSTVANAQKPPYQAPQNQPNQQQQNQWTYWQQWQQRSAGSQQTAQGAAPMSQFDTAQQYQQHLAQWKQQCARYYEQNPQQPHPSQHK